MANERVESERSRVNTGFGDTQREVVSRYLSEVLLDLRGPDKVVELTILSPNPEKFYFYDKVPVDLGPRSRSGGYFQMEFRLLHEGGQKAKVVEGL